MFDVNEYFEGKVKSIAFETQTLPATVGVMKVGEYTFATAKKETMTVVSGEMTVLLPGTNDWQNINQGENFDVPANAKFEVKVSVDSAYLCLYG